MSSKDEQLDALRTRIVEVRQRLGWSAKRFADELGISGSFWWNVENKGSKVPTELLLRIVARWPEVDAHWLLTGEPAPMKSAASEAPVPAPPPKATAGSLTTILEMIENRRAYEEKIGVVSLDLVGELRARFTELQNSINLEKRQHINGLVNAHSLEEDLLQESLWNQVREYHYRILPYLTKLELVIDLLARQAHRAAPRPQEGAP